MQEAVLVDAQDVLVVVVIRVNMAVAIVPHNRRDYNK